MDYIRACFNILYFFMRNSVAHKIFTLRMSTNKKLQTKRSRTNFLIFWHDSLSTKS